MIFQLLALFITIGTFIPLIRCDYWMIRGWDFPRIQLFVAGLLVMPGLFIFGFSDSETGRDWLIIFLLASALLALAIWMWRYTPLHKKEVLDGTSEIRIKFLVSNVLMYNRKSDKLLSHIREYQPDIFVALETDKWWNDKLSNLSGQYPHAVELPQEDTYGMVVRSRIPLIGTTVEYIIRENIPSVHAAIHLSDGTLVKLHILHPKPPFPDEDSTSTDRDAELLIIGKRAEEHGGPTIVLGDLNDVAWSRTTRLFQKISRLLDPRVGRGFFSTFHAHHWFLRWPLDHIFISDHFRVIHLKRLPSVGSDHFPMFAEFCYQPEGANHQEAPEEQSGDKAEADEKISAAN
ncbi:endonuclease/exonuclease/phosphatase family protein [Luteolibacter algae]|uniref:Endonuclease/exonuclease/phosphatase family protein n=1 Tax=Luteolibacter algae TaxID=454151 RepID=A0ABW5D6L3_9BACT